jgi:hypothetical protein
LVLPAKRSTLARFESHLKESTVTSKFNLRFTGCLLAGLVLSSAEAQAGKGFTVSTSEENAIAIGMSASEVQQLLGRPARAIRYRNAPGPTWTYQVVGAVFGKTEFIIEFGPDERVISKSEMVIGSEKPS